MLEGFKVSKHKPREMEFKLDVAPSALPDLKAKLLSKLGGEGTSQHLVSVYYDTPKHALRSHGMTVRVRSVGDKMIQTVKAIDGANAGLFDRSEWETAIAGKEPDIEALARTPAGALIAKGRGALKPVFETVVDRTLWTVETRHAAIEVALDQGKVDAGSASHPLTELEFELKRGNPAELFKLVKKLGGASGLRPGVRAKSERGYALALKKPPRAYKAEPIALKPSMTTAEAFRAILHSCIRQFCLNEPLLVATRTAEPLHQARVALRRLRSALSLFGPVVADDRLDSLKNQLQAVSRELGEARNIDVYLGGSVLPEVQANPKEPGAAAFVDAMETRRSQAYDRVVETLAAKAFRGLMVDLIEWVEAGPWLTDKGPMKAALRGQPIQSFAAEMLQRGRRTVKKKGRHLDRLDPHARHRVRIAAKKLRYAAEFFAALAKGDKAQHRHAGFITALEDLQEHLGELNDIQTAHDMALGFESASSPGGPALFAAAHVSGEQDAKVADLLAKAGQAHGELVDAKRFWSRWD